MPDAPTDVDLDSAAPGGRGPLRHAPGLVVAGAAAAACALALLPARGLDAQEPAPAPGPVESVGVDLAVEGVNFATRPRARVTVDRAAYVAVFEVEPGVGAVMLWPHDLSPQRRVEAGTHEFVLNGPRMGLRRSLLVWHLASAFLFRSTLQTRSHLVAVASEAPIRTGDLHSDRVFAYRHGSAPTREVTGALLSRVVDAPMRTPWSYATVSFPKYWVGQLGAVADPLVWAPFVPVHVPLAPGLDLALRDRCGPERGFSFFFGALTPAHLRRDVCGERTRLPRLTSLELPPRSVPAPSGEDAGTPAPPRPPEGPEDGEGAELPVDPGEILRRVADARERTSESPGRTDRRLERLAETLAGRGVPVRAPDLRRARRDARARAEEAWKRRRAERLRRLGLEGGRAVPRGTAGLGGVHGIPATGGAGARRVGGVVAPVGAPGVGSVSERVRSAVERARERGRSGRSSGSGSGGDRSAKGG